MRYGHAFDINGSNFKEHHPEIAVSRNILEKMIEEKDSVSSHK